MPFLGCLSLVAINVAHVACKFFRPPVLVTPLTFEDEDIAHQQRIDLSPLGGSRSLSENNFGDGNSSHNAPQGNSPRGVLSKLMVKKSSPNPLAAIGLKHYSRDRPSTCIISTSVSSKRRSPKKCFSGREMALAPKSTKMRGFLLSKTQSHDANVACGVCKIHCQDIIPFRRRDPQSPVKQSSCYLWRTGAVVPTSRKRSLDESSDGFSNLKNYKNLKRSARVNSFTYGSINAKGEPNNITWFDPLCPNWVSRTGRISANEYIRFWKLKALFHSNDGSLRYIRVDASNKRAYVPEGALHKDVISDGSKAWANKRLEPELYSGSHTQVYRFQWSGNMIAYKSAMPGYLRWYPSGSSENPKRSSRGDSFAIVPDRPGVSGYSKTPVGFDTATESFVKRQKKETEFARSHRACFIARSEVFSFDAPDIFCWTITLENTSLISAKSL